MSTNSLNVPRLWCAADAGVGHAACLVARVLLAAACALGGAGGPAAAQPASATPSAAPPAPAEPGACQALVERLAAFKPVDCSRLALQAGNGRSARGRPILMRDFGAPGTADGAALPPDPAAAKLTLASGAANASATAPSDTRPIPAPAPAGTLRKPRVLLVGGIHGDELTATVTVLRWADWLARDAAAGRALPIHWRVVPAMNPDGLLARPATRVNANGVDLNRNFPTPGWEPKARQWWEGTARKDPRRFPGRAAASEPETRWLLAEMERFAPDVIVSVHAPFGLLDYDGPKPQNLSPPRKLGRLYLDQIGVYPGSLGNYGGVHRGIAVLTIELPHALELPNDLELARMWTDLQRWIAEYMQRSAAAQAAAGAASHPAR